MSPILEALQLALVFVLGLVLRLMAFAVFVALFAVPIYLIGRAVGVFESMQRRALQLVNVNGLKLSLSRLYAPTHTWLARGVLGRVTVGLDDLAQRLLPAVTRVELPEAGTHVTKGQTAVLIEAQGRVVAIPAPVAGTILAANEMLAIHPAAIHEDPYGRGWLFRMRPDGPPGGLPSGERARSWFREEERRMSHFLDHELGLAAADGGELIMPAPMLLAEPRWRALVDAFLK